MFRPTMALSLFVVASTFAGCVEVRFQANPEFCTNARGDETCAERFPDGSRPYCVVSECLDDFYGCFPDVPGDNCASPCGLENPDCTEGMTTEGSTGSTSTGDTVDATETTTASSSTTGPQPCMGDMDCTGEAAPFCDMELGECVGCDEMPEPDMACAQLDPGAPLCVGGGCVECTLEDASVCAEQLLVCDDETNACVPCTSHEQCDADACDIDQGQCFDPANILHVGTGQPYGTIGAALDDVSAMTIDPAVLVLHGGASFDETATVDGGIVAFVAFEDEQPQWQHTGMPTAPTLTVTGAQTRVYLHRVQLSVNPNDLGLACDDGALLDVRRSRVVQNSGGGILATAGCELLVENSFVGGEATNVTALDVDNASITLTYTTIVGGLGSTSEAFACSPESTASVVDSLIVLQSDNAPVSCAPAVFDHCVSEVMLPGTNNVSAGSFTDVSTWFENVGAGEFSLSGTHPAVIETTALWNTGDPAVDIHGDLRSSVDGSPDYAGADVR